VSIITGCSETPRLSNEDFLIRVKDSVLTTREFKKILEISKSAYSHNDMQLPDQDRETQIRLLKELTEQMVILERATELGITVSETELEEAVSEITNDYPAGAFEQSLLEYAVSYKTWRERLRIRMLMEKVIREELKDHIRISPEDIRAYYGSSSRTISNFDGKSENINKLIADPVRREKTETAYRSWIQALQKKYNVEINRAAVEKIIDL